MSDIAGPTLFFPVLKLFPDASGIHCNSEVILLRSAADNPKLISLAVVEQSWLDCNRSAFDLQSVRSAAKSEAPSSPLSSVEISPRSSALESSINRAERVPCAILSA